MTTCPTLTYPTEHHQGDDQGLEQGLQLHGGQVRGQEPDPASVQGHQGDKVEEVLVVEEHEEQQH